MPERADERRPTDDVSLFPGKARSDSLLGRRILFVVNVDWFFLSHRLPLALAAQAAGAEVWIAATDTGHSDEIQRYGLKFVPIRIGRQRLRVREELRAIADLVRAHRCVEPDIVHHVTIKPVLYGSLISRLHRTPTINAISGFGYLFGVNQNRGMRKLVEVLYYLALRGNKALTIFQNDEDREEFISRKFVRESQTSIIRGSGVNCDVFRPGTTSLPSKRLVMFASRMLREKGVEDFVNAARDLRREYPDVRFVLVGEPDESPSSVTTGELQAWHEEGTVEWWGRSERMETVLPQACMLVLPTFYREGLPKVLLEAGACGLPMISTDVPGCRDVVRMGQTGLLVAPHDPVGLTRAIKTLLDDEEYRQRLGAQARLVVETEFNVEGVVEQTLSLYRDALQGR